MLDDRSSKQKPTGGSQISLENILPKHAKKLPFKTKSYEFYLNKSNGHTQLYIISNLDHAGLLEVSFEKLEKLLKYLKAS